MNSFCAWYSFRMSFWSVPPSCGRARRRCSSATATYMASRIARRRVDRHRRGDLAEVDAGEEVLHVGERVDRRRRTCRPRRRASGSSESRPMSVGRSNAVDSPSPPAASRSWNRRFVSCAVPNPANIRIVQSFERYIDAYGPAGVRVLARELAVVGPVDGLDRDARHRLEVAVAPLGLLERRLPSVAAVVTRQRYRRWERDAAAASLTDQSGRLPSTCYRRPGDRAWRAAGPRPQPRPGAGRGSPRRPRWPRRWMGRGDKNGADGAAVDAMRARAQHRPDGRHRRHRRGREGRSADALQRRARSATARRR